MLLLLLTSHAASCKEPIKPAPAAETIKNVLEPPTDADANLNLAEEPERPPFAPNIPWYATASKPDAIRVMSAMRKILDDDWNSSDLKIPLLKPRMEEAARKCPTDPRISYGWGLFLAHHGQPDAALVQFEEAVKRSPQFLAGHQAVAWYRLDRGDFTISGKHLAAVIKLIAVPNGDYPAEDQKNEAARWLGRVIGYLDGPVTNPPTELIEALKTSVSSTLANEQQALVEEGRLSAIEYWQELQQIAALSHVDLKRRLQGIRLEVAAQQQTLATLIGPVRQEIQQGQAASAEAQRQLTLAVNGIQSARLTAQQQMQKAAQLTRSSYGTVIKEKVRDYEYETNTRRDPQTGKETKFKEKVFKGYKTVERKLPETVEQNQRRHNDIQQSLDQAEGLNKQADAQFSQLKGLQLQLRELQKAARKEYREQHAQLATLMEDEAELNRRVRQLDGWIANPALFTTHIHRIEPYVPWDATTQRTAVLVSFDPQRLTTGCQ